MAQDGSHYPLGISDEFVPAILQLDDLDPMIAVCDGDCILMAPRLAAELGIAVGISSGANFLADVRAQDEPGDDAVVATVFADDNKKYLSTDLLRYEPHQVALPRSRSHPDRLSHRPSRLQRVR